VKEREGKKRASSLLSRVKKKVVLTLLNGRGGALDVSFPPLQKYRTRKELLGGEEEEQPTKIGICPS